MATKQRYTLVSSVVPKYDLVKEKDRIIPVITSHHKAGGTKLKFRVKEIETTRKYFLWGLFSFPVSRVLAERDEVYLKPFKQNVAKDRKDVPKNFWGNPNSPFAGIWVLVGDDYTDWSQHHYHVTLEECKHHEVIRHCNVFDEKFTIYGPKDPFRPSTSTILLWELYGFIIGLFKKSKV